MALNINKIVLLTVLATSSLYNGCGMLGGGGGSSAISNLLGKFKDVKPPGAKLTDGPENDLFMTNNEMASAGLPYMAVTNGALEPDGANLYGNKNFK